MGAVQQKPKANLLHKARIAKMRLVKQMPADRKASTVASLELLEQVMVVGKTLEGPAPICVLWCGVPADCMAAGSGVPAAGRSLKGCLSGCRREDSARTRFMQLSVHRPRRAWEIAGDYSY